MRLVVDGYNLLHEVGGEIEELIRSLGQYARTKRIKVMLCLDATQGGRLSSQTYRERGITLRYSGRGVTADDLIVEEASKLQGGCVVVTSDRELQGRVERLGASWIRSGEFFMKMQMAEFGDKDEVEPEERLRTKKGNPKKKKKGERQKDRRLKKL